MELALRITYAQGLSIGSTTDRLVSGTPLLDEFKTTIKNGSGANKGTVRHVRHYSFAAGDTDFDLTVLATDRIPTGNQAFTLIKLFILRLTAPATGKLLLVGNYGTNGFVGWQPGTTTAEKVHKHLIRDNPIDGWTVDATHKGLRVNNPGMVAVPADLIIIGE